MQHAILVPTSRYVTEAMRGEVGKIPPVIIPIHGKPLLDLIVKERNRTFPTAPIYLAVNQGKQLIWELLSRAAYENVHTIEVPELPDLGETVEWALKHIPLSHKTQITINFGDTLVNFKEPPTGDTVFFEICRESYLWTSFEERAGKIIKITDRFGGESLAPSKVFAGVFNIKEPLKFLRALELSKLDKRSKVSKFYHGLDCYLKGRSYSIEKAPVWLDFGHIENYHRARRRSSIARTFNSLVFSDTRPTVTKTSSHSEKLRHEIRWYLDLPQDFKCYAPQVIAYDLKKPSVELEYYGYPTVAELYVTAGHGLEIWWPVIKSVEGILKQMRTHTANVSSVARAEIQNDMYVKKTQDRIRDLKSHPVLGPLSNTELTVNGRKLPSLAAFSKALPQLCRAGGLLKPKRFTLIHGDFCFSNILFDTRMRLAKIIDPRGSFGVPSIYGDPRYDLAKVLHSYSGKYDLIKSNQFFALVDGTRLDYNIYTKPIHETASKFFSEILSESFSADFRQAELIEALLFASLISLHNESLHHQIAFLGIALVKLHGQAKRLGVRV